MNFPFRIKPAAEFDVVGFGTNAVDFLIQVPAFPEYNSKTELVDYVQAAGGEAATTVVGLQRLGLATAYIGRFGMDHSGDFGMLSLRDEGVDLRYAEQVTGARTQIAFIIIDARSGERTVIWERDKLLAYAPDEAPAAAAADARVLHFTPHDAAACRQMSKTAKTSGTIVSADVDNVFDGLEDLLPLIDVLIMSADFPRRLFGDADHRRALRDIASRYGCAVTGVTLGERGSLLLSGGEYIETPGFAVPGGCRDTTGAGDAYRVGLLYGLLKGETIERSAVYANAVAALKCRAIGARTSLPDAAELNAFLADM